MVDFIELPSYASLDLKISSFSFDKHMPRRVGNILMPPRLFLISGTISIGMPYPSKWKNSFALAFFVPKASHQTTNMVCTNPYQHHPILGNIFSWTF